jgi:small subunit ribosomal protein S9
LLEVGFPEKYIITSKVAGGGNEAQLEALILGVARALDKFDTATYHGILREKGYLTRDPRTRERRKVGNAGKARRKKSSPKR